MNTINNLSIGLLCSGLLLLGTTTPLNASGGPYSLQGEHQITYTLGGLADNDYEDFQGITSFEYSYWVSEQAAFSLAIGGISSDWDDDNDDYCCDRHAEDDGVGFVQVGMQLRPGFLNLSDKVYFTIQAMVGPYIGVNEYGYFDEDEWYYNDHYHYDTETDTETKWGAYLGLNLNVAVSKRFVIGASAGYHFVDEYEYPVNQETDFNSPDFRIRFSFML